MKNIRLLAILVLAGFFLVAAGSDDWCYLGFWRLEITPMI